MRKTQTALAISALLLAVLACNAVTSLAEPTSTPVVIVEPTIPVQPPNLPATEAEVTRVSLEEALTAYAAGTAVFVDVRSKQSFDISHIPGALYIPLGEFETNISGIDLPKDAWIITYCT